MAIGRTSRNGTITARVPSGVIRVTAQRSPSWWAEKHVTIRPGRVATLSLDIADGHEVSDETPLVLAEAVDDIVPASSKSFTLKFMREGRLVPVDSIEHIELDDPAAKSKPNLLQLFTISQGTIVAKNTSALFDALAADLNRTIRLRVDATDRRSLSRQLGSVSRRPVRARRDAGGTAIEPLLVLANIQVGASLMGAGIAVERVSDGTGRIRIESFPHGPIALQCVMTAEGRYYYGDAMLTHSGDRVVKLVLRHVSDVIKGVPALEKDGSAGWGTPGFLAGH